MSKTKKCLLALIMLLPSIASARIPQAIPEPTLYSLMGLGAVVAIIIYRINK